MEDEPNSATVCPKWMDDFELYFFKDPRKVRTKDARSTDNGGGSTPTATETIGPNLPQFDGCSTLTSSQKIKRRRAPPGASLLKRVLGISSSNSSPPSISKEISTSALPERQLGIGFRYRKHFRNGRSASNVRVIREATNACVRALDFGTLRRSLDLNSAQVPAR